MKSGHSAILRLNGGAGLQGALGASPYQHTVVIGGRTLLSHALHAAAGIDPRHIVALVGARVYKGEKQVLAADPYSESIDDRVRNAVRECIPGSEIVSAVKNERGIVTGWQVSHAMFWCTLDTVRDFNLLHRIYPKR